MQSGPGDAHLTASRQIHSDSMFDVSLKTISSTPIYTLQELRTITNALKFAAKLYEPSARHTLSTDANVTMPLLEYGVYGALQLACVGAPPKYVVACLLHDAFNGYVKGSRADLALTIDRKFGRSMSAGNTISNLINRISTPDRAEHDEWLARKKEIVTTLLADVPDGEMRRTPYSDKDQDMIMRAAKAANNLFLNAKPRKWGPDESLPMFRHAAEVGFLLLGNGMRAPVVAAALMHDFLEGYVKEDIAPLAQIEELIFSNFGQEVADLVHTVTEPPKGVEQTNWTVRKLSVVNQLMRAGMEANAIVCASKTSTIAEGNKYLHKTGTVQGWSAGNIKENIEVFLILEDLFARMGVPQGILDRFNHELKIFRSHDRARDARASDRCSSVLQ